MGFQDTRPFAVCRPWSPDEGKRAAPRACGTRKFGSSRSFKAHRVPVRARLACPAGVNGDTAMAGMRKPIWPKSWSMWLLARMSAPRGGARGRRAAPLVVEMNIAPRW